MQTVREETRKIHEQIVEDYYRGDSRNVLAKRYGFDPSTISKIITTDKRKNGERVRAAKPRDPRPHSEKKSLSQAHFQIGLLISLYRADHKLTPTAFGMLIDKSRAKVRDMEIGAHDFTLCEIMRLSEILEVPFETLVLAKPMEKRRHAVG